MRVTFSEFEVLSCLMERPGKLFTRQELLRAIWGDSAYRDPRAIDVHIRHLREKLEEKPRGAEPDPHGARRGVPLPGAVRQVFRRSGLRGRLLIALVATSALTLAVAAAALLPPLQDRLRTQRVDDLQAATEADVPQFEAVLGRALHDTAREPESLRRTELVLRHPGAARRSCASARARASS